MVTYNATATEEFAGALRETLLQDSEPADNDLLIGEMATQLIIELAYGTPSAWRAEGYRMLWHIYQIACVKQHIQFLGKHGDLMKDLAERAFNL